MYHTNEKYLRFAYMGIFLYFVVDLTILERIHQVFYTLQTQLSSKYFILVVLVSNQNLLLKKKERKQTNNLSNFY